MGSSTPRSAPGLAPVTLQYYPWGPHEGREWKVSQTSGGETRTTEILYDAAGNLTGVVPPGPGGDHHFAYNSRDLTSGAGSSSTSWITRFTPISASGTYASA